MSATPPAACSFQRSFQRFEILGQLGAGGAGVVYRARDPQLEREVAIKVLRATIDAPASGPSTLHTVSLHVDQAVSVGDLLAEARMMARLSHPNVLPVYEVGLAGDALFIVMELVDGASLGVWLATPRSRAEILDVFAQTARGLLAAHDHGIVHRDLKPDNVLIGRDGRVRVADFGLSQLAAPAGTVVRLGDTAGTPRYMAPELWAGAPATPASDVYAFCTALAEALGAEPSAEPAALAQVLWALGVPPALRAALVAGRAEAPALRPHLRDLVAALEIRPRGRGQLVLGAAIAAALGMAVALATAGSLSAPPLPACAGDPGLLTGRWDTAVRAQLAAKLSRAMRPPAAGDGDGDAALRSADQLLAATDAIAHRLVDAPRTICEARLRGELTAREAGQRASCVERRAMELGASAHAMLDAAHVVPVDYEENLLGIAPETCAGLELPPLGDRAAVEANYRCFAQLWWLAPADRLTELPRLAGDAAAAGDAELETRARVWLGRELHDADRIADAIAELDVAYRRASETGNVGQEAIALARRVAAEITGGNVRVAEGFARLARELAERSGTPPLARVVVYRSLGRAEHVRGQYAAAVATLRTGLDLIQQHELGMASVEIPLRMDLIAALLRIDGGEREGLALARQTAARARVLLGPDALDTAVAINLVAVAYSANGMHDQELPHRREALDIVQRLYPPEHSQVLHQRGQLARTLLDLGRAGEARAELEQIVATAERHPAAVRGELVRLLADLGAASYAVGAHAEGIAWLERGLDAATSELGDDHVETLAIRSELAELCIDAGLLGEADKQIAALVRIHGRGAQGGNAPALARVRGALVARIERARHRPGAAEQIARDAIAELARAAAQPADRFATLGNLGAALVDQGKFADAVPVLQVALAAAIAGHARDDRAALIELELARAELGLGDAAAAAQRAERVRAVLDRFAGHRAGLRELAALRAQLAAAPMVAAAGRRR